MVNLSTIINSLKLSNPTILASGVMDEDSGSMIRALKSGAAAVVTKSIGIKPRNGHANPTVIETEHGMLNALGLPNPGIDNYKDEIISVKKSNGIVLGSIFGSTIKEFIELSEKMQSYKVDALELNLSCPHAEGYGLEVGQDPKLVEKIILNIKNKVEIPVYAKLSSNVNNISVIAKAAENAKADAIVAINTVKAMKINIDIQKPVLGNISGGYSGGAIKPIGIKSVYDIYRTVDIPIIGVGGILTGKDALEYIMAGASAVQIGSGVYFHGIDIFNKVCDDISDWMKQNNYNKIEELIGVAHK